MNEEKIEFTINPDGTLSVNMQGFKGSICENTLDKLSAAVGLKMHKKRKKEFYEKTVNKISQKGK